MIRILFIEDEEILRTKVSSMLSMVGYEVDEAENGQKGLEMALKTNYDLLLSDINMPEVDGYDVLKELQNHEDKRVIPFIFLTANIEKEMMRKGMNLGADDYITKPFSIEELTQAINSRLRKKKDLQIYYEKAYKDRIENMEQQFFRNPATGILNEYALHKFLESENKSSEYSFFYIEIIGIYEISFYLNRQSLFNILTELIGRIRLLLRDNEYFFQTSQYSFVIIWKDITDRDYLQNILLELQVIIREPIGKEDFQLTFDSIIGISSTLSNQESNLFDIFEQARVAKDYAKQISRENCTYYNEQMKEQIKQQLKDIVVQHVEARKEKEVVPSGGNQEIYEIKVFFLYPHSVIQEDLIKEIVRNEYEAYVLDDHEVAYKLVQKYAHSILFINIDAGLSEKGWEEYIEKIRANPSNAHVRIGILSYNKKDDSTVEKYLIKMVVECGFVQLKLGFEQSKEIILKTLEVNEARGRRKFVRVNCGNINNVSFNMDINGKNYEGSIMEISSAGMLCCFAKEQEVFLKKDSEWDNIQLKLKGNICRVTGKIAATRHGFDDNTLYLIMYDWSRTDAAKVKIHDFIYRTLQIKMNEEKKNL